MAKTSSRTVRFGRVILTLAAGLVGLGFSTPGHAEDLKGKWYFGGNLSFLSTTDDIRSNSAIIIGPLGDDGIPFTGDPNEEQGCIGQGSVNTFCDPRPDDLLGRENAIEETFKYDLTAGFGLTSWLSFQLDASYFKGDVGPVDAFLRDAFPIATNPLNPSSLNVLTDRETVIPVQAGVITEIPVSLSGIVRFRKDSPLNPYIGAGVGMIFTDLDRSSDVDELNARLATLRILGATDEFGTGSIVPQQFQSLVGDGRVPLIWPLKVDVDDAFEWHLTGGAEYFFNDRFSILFDARYTFADQNVTLDLGGEDQIDLIIFSEALFRPDGSVKIFNKPGTAPNPFCADSPKPNAASGCTSTSSPDQRVKCEPGATGDFDGDGNMGGRGGSDLCYNPNLEESPRGAREPKGIFVVQGGKIDLTGFSVAVGVRFHF